MSKVCMLTGKRPTTGHNVSHSKRRTIRRWLPNLQVKKVEVEYIDRNGAAATKTIKMRVAMSSLRTLYKEPSKHEMKKMRRKLEKRQAKAAA
ncbi:TPA: 50S ribosomal protein L28 [Candidatus Gracilibacteria bacterium]|nr:50S ribosomal protein L28 [Candidatus Peregrinibacteria bacterium]HIQ56466.1 50S ribosomal protein L28 [Candidatus Gracilibacteria bacterium]HIQ57772.1 50S ribosomal protein L28 [Candidatus Gracilibacteria bacterium]